MGVFISSYSEQILVPLAQRQRFLLTAPEQQTELGPAFQGSGEDHGL